MADLLDARHCSCPCGAATFSVHARPLARFFCHCLICQGLYKAPFADVTAFWAGGERLASQDAVHFKRYRLPPALRRATCRTCAAPVLGYLRLAPGARLLFVSTPNLKADSALPPPTAHIFYHRRVADAEDRLPKFSGYWKSQYAVTSAILGGLTRGRN